MKRDDLVAYLNDLLTITAYRDYAPNGLQVQGAQTIRKVITGVTASQALIDKAIECGADAILVHHGYFWKGEAEPIVGMKHARIKALLAHDINLLAYHLPLDGHPTLGNSAQLGRVLDIPVVSALDSASMPGIGLVGEWPVARRGEDVVSLIGRQLGRAPLHVAVDKPIQRIAWITGGAQDGIEDAARAGCDAYISGEISERTTHSARELGLHYFAAGHHATERYGVQALGEHLAETFALECHFVDVDNPA